MRYIFCYFRKNIEVKRAVSLLPIAQNSQKMENAEDFITLIAKTQTKKRKKVKKLQNSANK